MAATPRFATPIDYFTALQDGFSSGSLDARAGLALAWEGAELARSLGDKTMEGVLLQPVVKLLGHDFEAMEKSYLWAMERLFRLAGEVVLNGGILYDATCSLMEVDLLLEQARSPKRAALKTFVRRLVRDYPETLARWKPDPEADPLEQCRFMSGFFLLFGGVRMDFSDRLPDGAKAEGTTGTADRRPRYDTPADYLEAVRSGLADGSLTTEAAMALAWEGAKFARQRGDEIMEAALLHPLAQWLLRDWETLGDAGKPVVTRLFQIADDTLLTGGIVPELATSLERVHSDLARGDASRLAEFEAFCRHLARTYPGSRERGLPNLDRPIEPQQEAVERFFARYGAASP